MNQIVKLKNLFFFLLELKSNNYLLMNEYNLKFVIFLNSIKNRHGNKRIDK